MQMIFDTHAHYDDDAFQEDRAQILGEMLPAAGVCNVVNIGADLQGCYDSVALANAYDYIYAAVGIHPGCVQDLPADYLAQLEALLRDPKAVAVGEIGLDYFYKDNAPKEIQQRYFAEQLELAKALDLPVVIHDREAHGDTMTLLRKYRPKGIVHCFSGSVEMMQEIVSLGMSIGLGGAVTFKNAKTPVAVAAAVPLEHLVLETDAPYMTPVPFRGKRNHSALIAYTAERIAQARTEAGSPITAEELLRITKENAYRIYGILPKE